MSRSLKKVFYSGKKTSKEEYLIREVTPLSGKTYSGLVMVQKIGIEGNKPVLIFSLELNANDIVGRLAASMANVKLSKIKKGQVNEEEHKRLTKVVNKIKRSRIFVEDSEAPSIHEIKARARRVKAENSDLGLVVIDYIQLINNDIGKDINRDLEILAREIETPVFAISQI